MNTGYENVSSYSELVNLRDKLYAEIDKIEEEIASRELRNPLNLNVPGSSVAVKFTKFFGKDKPYLFTAVGVSDHSGRSRWTVSGSAERVTWAELKDFMAHRESDESTYRVFESFTVI